jgi:hypothetical protein
MQYEEALRKVRSLLNLADAKRGATQEEAAQAAAMAQRIMDKFGIDINDADFDSNQATADAEPIKNFGHEDPLERMDKSHDYEDSWSVLLANVIARQNQCLARYMRVGKNGFSVRIIGRPSDVNLVRYLYGFFKQQIKNLKSEHCKGNSSAYKGEFCKGCIDTLSRKLEQSRKETFAESKAENINNPQALVRVDKAIQRIEKRAQEVAQWFAANNTTGTRGGGFRGSSVGIGGRAHGQQAGQSIRMTGARGSLGSSTKSLPSS